MACADGSTSHRPGFKQTSYSNLKYKFMNKTFIRQAKRSFTFLFMLGLCAIWSPRAAAQNRSLPQVTIRMDRVPMSQIMSEIERQTKYLFVTGSDVKTDRITSLDVTAVPLTEALNRMVAGADLTYDIRSLSIILSVKKAERLRPSQVMSATGAASRSSAPRSSSATPRPVRRPTPTAVSPFRCPHLRRHGSK